MNSACTHIIREEILLICQLVHFFVTNMPIIEKAYRNNINSKHFHIANFILYWACEGLHLSLVCIHTQLCTAVLCSDSITCENESWNVLHFGLIEQDLDTANQSGCRISLKTDCKTTLKEPREGRLTIVQPVINKATLPGPTVRVQANVLKAWVAQLWYHTQVTMQEQMESITTRHIHSNVFHSFFVWQ